MTQATAPTSDRHVVALTRAVLGLIEKRKAQGVPYVVNPIDAFHVHVPAEVQHAVYEDLASRGLRVKRWGQIVIVELKKDCRVQAEQEAPAETLPSAAVGWQARQPS